MSQNSQTHFKILAEKLAHLKLFKVCLTILGHYELKG